MRVNVSYIIKFENGKLQFGDHPTDRVVSQGSMGTCWAFGGTAALEAAYARAGIRVKLSKQYLFYLSKAHENHRVGPRDSLSDRWMWCITDF
jgi:C1A family cysteine protease